MLGRSRGKRGSRRRGNLTPWTGLLLLVLGWAACYFSYVSPVWGEGSRIQDSDGASQPSTIEEENEPSPATLSSVEPSQEEEDYPPPHDEGTMKAVSASAWRSPVAPNFHAARRARHFSGRDRTYTDLKHMKNGIEAFSGSQSGGRGADKLKNSEEHVLPACRRTVTSCSS